MDKLRMDELIMKFKAARSRCILLDYDGTMVDFTSVPEIIMPTEQISEVLQKLVRNPGTHLYIITGRSYKDAVKIFENVPATIIAEHGAIVRENGEWIPQVIDGTTWRESVINALDRVTEQCPGSFIEEKSFALAWHYRNADPLTATLVSRDLICDLSEIAAKHDIKIIDGNKVVEIMTNKIGKGRAVERIFSKDNFDFVLSVGDDRTDEEMFAYLLNVGVAYTIKVGNGDTCARYILPGTDDVLKLLKKLAL